MNNLLNYLTKPQVARSYSPMFDLFNTLEQSFAAPGESFSNDNIRFNENKESSNIEIDLPGVKKDDLKVTYNEENHQVYVEAKRTVTAKTGSKEETYNRSFSVNKHDFEVERLKAEIIDGVLRINVPRVERAEPKVIDVQVG